MTFVDVDCRFTQDGTVDIRRVKLDGSWLPAEQGRQWQDDNGRHVLIILPGQLVHELLLEPTTLRWELRSLPGRQQSV